MPKTPFEDPTTLVFIGTGSSRPIYGKLTLRKYIIGDHMKYLTVEKKDAPALLTLGQNGRNMFRVLSAEEEAELAAAETVVAAAPAEEEEAVKLLDPSTLPVDYALVFSGYDGIGEATAQKLVAAGFTPEALIASPAEDVAKAAGISLAFAEKAIAGAQSALGAPTE